ncbi:urea-proton symporter DUR3-like [Octopus vulgaris]|uniref:Urea-proton symporter DUR3-like n=1 Tax=Octopus vulgaris TaxID=6645 RepID=A0AA36B159_OCTVU|nr:urea-proton symporter DUR3-like [Octopus vulgaris]
MFSHMEGVDKFCRLTYRDFWRLLLFFLAFHISFVDAGHKQKNLYTYPQNNSDCPRTLVEVNAGHLGVKAVLAKHESALLMLLGFGGFSVILAILYNAVRKYIYHDEHNLDTTFDAGGNVSLSLTAVTVASQLFWPGDILQSATLATKNGIAGPFWYAVGVMINILIFPILSVHFKTRAPGAKTYLQVMYARYGRAAHAVFCVFALMTNLIITIGVILAGQATIKSLTKDASDEFSIIIMATLFGSYSLIGGLGTTFYVSYFNACLVFVLLIIFVAKIFFVSDERYSAIGSMETMYDAIICLKGPEANEQNSFLTFRSSVALLYGVIEIFVSSAVTFCDQASWQSRIAAKPAQGVWGFILAGFMWFSVPACMATTTGMAYLALSSKNGTHMLSVAEIDEGLVTPMIAEKILGEAGGIMILTMGSMALMSTGSGEVMAVSSIIVYDIYQTYIKPFRRNLKRNQCVLCGKTKVKMETNGDLCDQNGSGSGGGGGSSTTARGDNLNCKCLTVSACPRCKDDLEARNARAKKEPTRFRYQCPTHGSYREYQDDLIAFKNWCIVWVTISIIPLGLMVFMSGINLNWIFYVGAILTIPYFPPVLLSILWVKATGKGLIAGSMMGLLCGTIVTLGVASTYPGGLGNFLINTVQDNVLLAGTITSFARLF